MPNLYVTPEEIKAGMPDGIQATTTKYDGLLLQLAHRISRFIDQYCRQSFYPILATRYYDCEDHRLDRYIDHAISITTVSMSSDDGSTYTDLAVTDWIGTRAGDYNHLGSQNMLRLNENGTYSYWYRGQRSLKVIGVFAFHDERDSAWEDSLDAVQDDPKVLSTATTLTVGDADGADLFGLMPRFQVGQFIQIEDEFCEVTQANISSDKLTIIRARNGTTAADHDKNKSIEIYRPPGPVKQAALIQALIQMERGFQGFGDARAVPETGQIFFIKELDPQARLLLDRGFKRNVI